MGKRPGRFFWRWVSFAGKGATPLPVSRIVPLGESHLRRALSAFVSHYHGERHHQGLDGKLIVADDTAGRLEGPVTCRERLGGTLNFYYREAA